MLKCNREHQRSTTTQSRSSNRPTTLDIRMESLNSFLVPHQAAVVECPAKPEQPRAVQGNRWKILHSLWGGKALALSKAFALLPPSILSLQLRNPNSLTFMSSPHQQPDLTCCYWKLKMFAVAAPCASIRGIGACGIEAKVDFGEWHFRRRFRDVC
jgi:hypothetical protein